MNLYLSALDAIALPLEDKPAPILAVLLVVGLVLAVAMVIRNERK